MRSAVIDEKKSYFISDDNEALIVVHEDKGEVLRIEDGDEFEELVEDADLTGREFSNVLHELFFKAEIFEPQPNEIRIVPDN